MTDPYIHLVQIHSRWTC